MSQGYDLNNLRDERDYSRCSGVFLVKRDGVEMRELCGHLSLRCLFDVQVEMSRGQLDIYWAGIQDSGLSYTSKFGSRL